MSDKTKIEWTNATWNPVRGCSLVSSGCTNCYAMRQAHRQKDGAYKGLTRLGPNGPVWTGDVRFIPEAVDYPLRLKKPHMIFVNSMSDLFHESLPDEAIDGIFGVMGDCSELREHVFQVLTKRPARMLEYMNTRARKAWNAPRMNRSSFPPHNIWLGVSVEDQKTADERIYKLRSTPAAVRFVSYEPALNAIHNGGHCGDCGAHATVDGKCLCADKGRLHWWIAGGESGPKARPMHPDWARSLRDQCVAAGVPFFFKQWGEWARTKGLTQEQRDKAKPIVIFPDGHTEETLRHGAGRIEGAAVSWRVGKKAAGRLLDGREWNEFPATTEARSQ